jgi:hypothetical protein
MNGFAFRAVEGTPNIWVVPRQNALPFKIPLMTHMCEQFLRQSTPLRFIKLPIKGQKTAASFEAIPSQFQFVHCVNVLHVQFDTGSIGGLRSP